MLLQVLCKPYFPIINTVYTMFCKQIVKVGKFGVSCRFRSVAILDFLSHASVRLMSASAIYQDRSIGQLLKLLILYFKYQSQIQTSFKFKPECQDKTLTQNLSQN